MGKKEGGGGGGITLKNHGPSCMWGLFHHLQQNQWHKVVKRLPRARLVVYGKHSHSHSHSPSPSTGKEKGKASPNSEEDIDSDNDDDDDEPSSVAKPLVGQKHAESSPAHKHSMKSRIKAFTEEVYKMKGRHRRSTSYPVRKPPDENLPSHHEKGKSIDINNNNNNNVMPPTIVEGSTPNALPESSHSMRLNYLKQNEVDQLGQVRDHTILHGNSMYAIEPSTCDSLQESKLFMDALSLLNMREEMFMKIFKDPSLSLANQLQCRRSPNLRYGLNKSMSFSASATSDSRDFDVETSKRKQEGKNTKEDNQNTYIRRNHEEQILESASSSSSSSSAAAAAAHILRKKGDERVGLMHFKNIREKIKYVIRDRKKEKNRIMMDALHHKVPYGTSPSKKLAEDAEQAAFDFGKSSAQDYKRMTSFDNSLDRYKQLIDVSSSSNEGKDRSCDELKVNVQPVIGMKPASLRRILSLPDIRSNIKSLSASTKEERKLDSDDKAVSNSVLENQEEVMDVGETSDDSGRSRDFKDESRRSSDFKDGPETIDESRRNSDLKDESETIDESRRSSDKKHEPETVEESRKSSDLRDESKTSPDSEALKLEGDEKNEGVEEAEASVSEDSRSPKRPQKNEKGEKPDSSIYQQPQPQEDMTGLEGEEHELELYDSCVSPQGAVGIVEESQIQQLYNDLLHVQEDERSNNNNNNNPDFKYVKGVLELSGFSKNEALGKWHSSQNPLNPSVFEEIGGCSGECCEDGISNQLLLFDLINEVLLHIHERSFCFWPTPLTNRSTIHPLPKGSRVLEEVWTEIKWLLSSAPEAMDDAVSRDLGKNDGWMNLQLDAECVGLEMEELIFDDLVQEIFY